MNEQIIITRFIGIDPGVKSGLAIWDAKQGRILYLKSLSFFQALHKLLTYSEECKRENINFAVIIENPKGNRPTFSHHQGDNSSRIHAKISQDVGANKRDSALLFEFCELHNFPAYQITPNKNSLTKLTAEQFRLRFGWDEGGDQHARDAAGLIIGYKPHAFRPPSFNRKANQPQFLPG